MKRGWAVAVGVAGVSVVAAPACVYFTAVPADPSADGGLDANAPLPPRDGSSDASSGGFPRQDPPPFQPSFLADAGAGDVVATIQPTCAGPISSGGGLYGSYDFASFCFSTDVFAAPFAKYCDGLTVRDGKAAARVNGRVDTGDGSTAVRNGTVWLAAEIYAPCRQLAGATSTCATLADFVVGAFRQNRPKDDIAMTCYDQSQTECICQIEDVNYLDTEPLPVNSSAGTLGPKLSYGSTTAGFTYTGKVSTSSNTIEIDPAFVWYLARP